MRTWLVLSLCLLAIALCALGCGPSPEGSAQSDRAATAGMCPKCGCTNLDVQQHTERSAYDGEPVEYLTLTCRECGYSWRAPTLAGHSAE